MNNREKTGDLEHRWAIEAMPWRLNKTMKEKDMARLNTHLLECEACRDRFAAEQILAENMRRGAGALPSELPSAHESLAKLKAKRAQARTPRVDSELDAARRRKSAPGRWVYGAIAAQAVAIALLATWSLRPPAPVPAYQTMSPSQLVTGPHLKVEFAQDATVTQVRNALDAVDGRVAGGPSIAGVFVVVVGDAVARPAGMDLDESAQSLMSMPGVRFVAAYRGEQDTR